MCLFVSAVEHGVTEEEPIEEFSEQYLEPEPKDTWREQELPEGFEDGKSNLPFWCIFNPILQTQSIGLFIKLHVVCC